MKNVKQASAAIDFFFYAEDRSIGDDQITVYSEYPYTVKVEYRTGQIELRDVKLLFRGVPVCHRLYGCESKFIFFEFHANSTEKATPEQLEVMKAVCDVVNAPYIAIADGMYETYPVYCAETWNKCLKWTRMRLNEFVTMCKGTYKEILGAVPPRAQRPSSVLCGEPNHHHQGQPVYLAIFRNEAGTEFGRYCTIDEFRSINPNQLPTI